MTCVPDHATQRPIGDSALEQRLLQRARFLEATQYALVRASFDKSMPRRHLAQLMGVPEGTLARRIARLRNRLYDPTVVALIDHGQMLRPELRQVALERLLHGHTLAKIAAAHRITRAQVVADLEYVRGWVRGISMRKTFADS